MEGMELRFPEALDIKLPSLWTDALVRGNVKAPKCGIILRLELENFLNFEKYDIEFARNVNIIVGKEIGGVSSILVAITTALGGVVNVPGAGSEHVKEGKEEGVVKLTIGNEGRNGLFPNKYGNRIVIRCDLKRGSRVRNFSFSGSNGEIVAKGDRELNNVVEHFLFQPNNPYCIVHANTLSTVMTKHSYNEKYEYFLVATHISEMEERLQKMVHLLEEFSDVKKRTLPMLRGEKTPLESYMKKMMNSYKEDAKESKKFMIHEKERLIEIREAKLQICSNFFTKFLTRLGLTGYLTADHEKRELDVEIHYPEEGGTPRLNIYELAEEEIAFSIVAFVITLWEASDTPIAGIDNFDSFLNESFVNQTLNLIILQALAKPYRQFFITASALEIEKQNTTGMAKIIRLPEELVEKDARKTSRTLKEKAGALDLGRKRRMEVATEMKALDVEKLKKKRKK